MQKVVILRPGSEVHQGRAGPGAQNGHFPDGLKMKETALVFIKTSQWWNVSSSLYTKINEHWEIL